MRVLHWISDYAIDLYAPTAHNDRVHTVVETNAFIRSARAAGMDDDERGELVAYLAANPLAGDLIQGTGGARKVRFAGRGKGKSGGYRTITFYGGDDLPVFLLTVYAKGQQSDLSQAERNEMRAALPLMVDAYRRTRR